MSEQFNSLAFQFMAHAQCPQMTALKTGLRINHASCHFKLVTIDEWFFHPQTDKTGTFFPAVNRLDAIYGKIKRSPR